MLAILPGQPAKGERQPASTAEDYSNLTAAQRDKLLAALAKRQPPKAETLPGCVKTEVPLLPSVFSAVACSGPCCQTMQLLVPLQALAPVFLRSSLEQC